MTALLSTFVRHCFVWGLFFSFSVLVVGKLRAAVVVRTDDGRVLVGEVDARTTAEQLWIRRGENQIVLTTPVAWDSIVAAAVDGKPAEVSTLAEQWPRLKSKGPAGIWTLAGGAAEAFGETRVEPRAEPRPQGSRIVALEIEAVLVNLDRDVEPDGFEVVIMALDVQGRAVPVRGNIQARLVGERDEQHLGRIRFEELQRWSQPVACADFQEGVARYSLRFRQVHPEFDWELIPYALLNVRLGVYGEGNFEASVPVEIRQFNPFRDQLQKYARSRFLRDELTRQVRRRGVARPGSGLQEP